MAGSLIRVDKDKWRVRIFLGRDEHGRTRHFNKTVYGNKKTAEKYLNQKLAEQYAGTLKKPTNESLGTHLEEWLNLAATPNVRPRTLEHYRSIIRSHITPVLSERRLADLRVIDVEKLYASMIAAGYSPKTVRHVHTLLSAALEKAIDWEKIQANPCKRVRLPKLRRKEMKFLTTEGSIRFLEAARSDELYALFVVAIMTGMRPEEYLALTWDDIDFDRSVLHVRRVLISQKGGGFIFDKPKTSKSERAMEVGETVLAALKAQKMLQLKLQAAAKDYYQDMNLVFASRVGTPIQHRNLDRRHFKKILERAGLPTIRLYDLRHTASTLMHAAGVNVKVISERLGHASSVLTLDTYSHVTPSMQKESAEKIESLFRFPTVVAAELRDDGAGTADDSVTAAA